MVKALFINGSPRKNFNTAQLLQRAMDGAREAGAEVEMVNLYDPSTPTSSTTTAATMPPNSPKSAKPMYAKRSSRKTFRRPMSSASGWRRKQNRSKYIQLEL